jgi:hypothetical protein
MEGRERRSRGLAELTGLRRASGQAFSPAKVLARQELNLIKINNIRYLIGY